MEQSNLAGPHGFRHIRRGLEAGETLPRCPLLVEQLLAISSNTSGFAANDGEAEPVVEMAELEEDDDLDE